MMASVVTALTGSGKSVAASGCERLGLYSGTSAGIRALTRSFFGVVCEAGRHRGGWKRRPRHLRGAWQHRHRGWARRYGPQIRWGKNPHLMALSAAWAKGAGRVPWVPGVAFRIVRSDVDAAITALTEVSADGYY